MSFKNEYTLNVDIKRRMTSVVPTFKQGDSATLKFKLFDDGKKFDLAAFTRAEITFKSPSGQTIVGEPYIDVNTQMIVYNFVGVEMNEAGKLTTILSIYSGTSMVSIQPFSIFIFDHLKDKDLSYIGILQDLIAEVQLLNEEVKSTLSEANNLKDELNDVLIEANSAEQTRNTNEQNRISSENTRNSNESARQQNELDRKNAESKRESSEATRIENEQNRQNEFDNKINEAEVAITDTKNATEKANQAAESIKGWGQATVWNSTTTYSKNNVVTYNGSTWQSKGDNNLNSIPSETNTNWILLALRGVDGTGAVSTVNSKSPDGAGNVELTADEIGTYTQQQIDDKDTAIKEYFTDKGIGDKVIVISEQDYIDADYNGMFWVKNDALDFLPTETDHAATLLVYENPDNENVVKIFNVINPTTAIFYMRTYTFDNTSSLIHDSGWIEGGGGSGTGGGGNVSVNSYPLVTDTVSQTIWELPTGAYNQTTDSVMVFHNTVFLEQVSYTITNIRLSIPDNPHTEIEENNVVLVVFRNMPNMTVEFDGNNIIDGSIPLSKLGQDVQDAINNAGGKIELVDNLTTDDATKALAASQGFAIKSELDKKWQKGVYNDTDITNLGANTASKTLVINTDDWKSLANVESVYINIPTTSFSGIIKVTYVSDYHNSDSGVGAVVEYHIHAYNGAIQKQQKTIMSISPQFAKYFLIGDVFYGDDQIYIMLYKGSQAKNPMTIKLDIVSSSPIFNIAKNIGMSILDTNSPTAYEYPWTPQVPTFLMPNTYSASNTITNIGANRATRVFPQINWQNQGTELWETTFSLPASVWGLLELDIAGYSAGAGGAKIVVELGINVISQTQPSSEFRNYMKVVSASAGFTENFYVEFEHRAEARIVLIKVYKRVLNDPVTITATFTSTASPMSAFEFLGGFHTGVLYPNTTVPTARQKDFDTRINENFTSVSNGKVQVASAITGKGVQTASDATFETMANNINKIPTGVRSVKGTFYVQSLAPYGKTTINIGTFPFNPAYVSTNLSGAQIANGLQAQTPNQTGLKGDFYQVTNNNNGTWTVILNVWNMDLNNSSPASTFYYGVTE
ncbi:hypothetical protein [Lysinibacillus pakistanensis]|uniref:hypothetical protein n=1 Tax=Lysinibacillus pakistanensis TaxID=759811 RepID=UPI003D27A590